MATVLFTGNSEPVSAVVVIRNPNQVGDVQITIQGVNFYFAEWNATAIAEAINGSTVSIMSTITATPTGSDVTLVDDSGRDIVVSLVVRVAIDIETLVDGRPKKAQVTRLTLPSTVTGGTWTLTINGETTGNLAFDITQAALQTAVDGLATPANGEILVAKLGANIYRLTFGGQYLGFDVSVAAAGSALTGQSIATVETAQQAGGTGKAVYVFAYPEMPGPGYSTTPVSLKVNGVTVCSTIGTPGGVHVPWAKKTELSSQGFGTLEAMTSSIETALGTSDFELIEGGESGVYRVLIFVAKGSLIFGGLPTVQMYWPGTGGVDTYTISPMNNPLIGQTDEIVMLTYSASGTISHDGTSTSAISDYAAMMTALGFSGQYDLAYLAKGGPHTYYVNGSAYAYSTKYTFLFRFKGASAQTDLPEFTFSLGTNTAVVITDGALPVNEIQRVHCTGIGGVFKIGFSNQVPAATIAFPTSPATVKTHLETLAAIDVGDVVVTGGNGTPESPLLIEFTGQYAMQNVPNVVPVVSGITGGTVAVTGLQVADAGASERQRVQLRGAAADGTWRLELDNKPSGLIDWDASASELQTSLEACETIGAGNVSVTSGGVGIYLVDFIDDLAFSYVSQLAVNANDLVLANPADLVVYQQLAAGPEHWNDFSNWRDMETGQRRVPSTGDDVFLETGDRNIRFGLIQRAEFTALPASDQLQAIGHCFVNQQLVILSTTGTLPAPLVAGEVYKVLGANRITNRLLLAEADSTTPINITNQGSGVHTIRVALNSLRMKSSFDGDIGLPRFDEEGMFAVMPQHLRIGFTGDRLCIIGEGAGVGTSLTKIDVGDDETYFRVFRTANNSEAPAGAVQILCTNEDSEIRVDGGNVSLALMAGESASFNLLQANGGQVNLGRVDYKAHEASVSAVVTSTDAILTGPMKVY